MPRQVDLVLSDELLDRLLVLSQRSGRSLNDLITDLLSRQLEPLC